jgi:thiol-disulfide isomerase/thioredoxin
MKALLSHQTMAALVLTGLLVTLVHAQGVAVTSYSEFAALPFDKNTRRVVFDGLPPTTRSAIAREHYRQLLVAHPEFSVEQRALILSMVDACDPEMFATPRSEASKAQMLDLDQRLRETFDSELWSEINIYSAGSPPRSVLSDRLQLKAGQRMPDFTFIDFTGRKRALSDFKGRHVLIQFWGTWCGACRDEIEPTKNVYAAFRERGLEVLWIDVEFATDASLDAAYERARRFISGAGMEWPQARGDSVGELLRLIDLVRFPTTVLLDPTGTLISAHRTASGEMPLRGAPLLSTLQKLLAGQSRKQPETTERSKSCRDGQ